MNFPATEPSRHDHAVRVAPLDAFEWLPVAVVQCTPEGGVIRANQVWRSLVGCTTADLHEVAYHKIVQDGEMRQLLLPESVASGKTVRVVTRAGHDLRILIRATPIPDAAGAVHSVVMVWQDVSAQCAGQAAQTAYQRELSLLVQSLQERERQTSQRMARALHDHLGQTLALVRMRMELLKPVGAASGAESKQDELSELDTLLGQALRAVRKMVADLQPPLLADQGLIAALAYESQSHHGPDGNTLVRIEGAHGIRGVRWPQQVEYGALMIAQDAINLARQQAYASAVRVTIEGGPDELRMGIIADGRWPTQEAGIAPTLPGTAAMREHANGLGAQLTFVPQAGDGMGITFCWKAPAQ